VSIVSIIIIGTGLKKTMGCEFCDLVLKKDKLKIYFESEEIMIIEQNPNLAIAIMKEHKAEWSDSKVAGLTKMLLKSVSKNNLNKSYVIRVADDCQGHYGIYATIN